MKPISLVLVALGAAFVAAGAAVLGVSYLQFSTEAVGATPAPPRAAAATAGEASEVGALAARLDRLGGRLDQLESEVRGLREDASREPAPAAGEQDQAPPLPPAGFEVTEEQRAAIVQVLAEVRAAEEGEREERQLQREEDSILERAERIANEVGLSAADQKALSDHMLVAAVKRREVMDRARQDGWDRTTIRDDFMELRDWSGQALTDTFGSDLARQIQEADRGSRFGPPGGFGREGGGRGGGGSQNGGGGGRGQRGN